MPRGRRFWRDEHGGTAVLMAFGMIFTLGFAALGVDYARAIAMEQALSSAADAAALAAATRLPDGDAARKMALEYVEKNLPRAQYGETLVPSDVEIGSWDAATATFIPAGGFDDDDDDDDGGGKTPGATSVSLGGGTPRATAGMTTAVRVTTRLATSNGNEMAMLFAPVLGRDSLDVAASAVAGRGGPPCVIALDPTGSSSMALGGSAQVEAAGCGVQVNSTAGSALSIKGSASLQATDICVGGEASSKSGAADPEPREYCPGLSDPLAGLAVPDFDGCDYNDTKIKGSTEPLEPGVYCGGLDIGSESDVELEPGLYVIQDDLFAVGSKSSIQGEGVTIFLTGAGALISFKSGATINLTAPTSGALAGILFFQDPVFGGTHDWKGKSSTELRGVIYFPAGKLVSKNDNAMTPEASCTVLIAHSLEFTASSGVSVDVSGVDCRGSLAGPYRRGIALLQ